MIASQKAKEKCLKRDKIGGRIQFIPIIERKIIALEIEKTDFT